MFEYRLFVWECVGGPRKESFMIRISKVLLIVATMTLMVGCTAGLTTVSQKPPAKYETLGNVEGSSSGSLLILSTAYNFIPVGLNDRAERAYKDALMKSPGATGLIDVTYKEDWFWYILGTARNVTITGTAIKEVAE